MAAELAPALAREAAARAECPAAVVPALEDLVRAAVGARVLRVTLAACGKAAVAPRVPAVVWELVTPQVGQGLAAEALEVVAPVWVQEVQGAERELEAVAPVVVVQAPGLVAEEQGRVVVLVVVLVLEAAGRERGAGQALAVPE